MAKFLLFNIPYQGHVNPTLAIVQELVAHGEKVIYYLTDEFKYIIQSTGAVFRSYETTFGKPMQQLPGARATSPAPRSPVINESFYVIPQLLDDIRAERPDYIIYDAMCLWGRLLAQSLQVPAIIMRCNYATNEHYNMFEHFYTIIGAPSYSPALAVPPPFRKDLERLCTMYNIQPFDPLSINLHSEALNIIFTVRAFHPAGDTFDERFKFVGPPILPHTQKTDFPLDQLGKQPTLYISLGTIHNNWANFFNMCFTAFRNQPWQVILSIGKKVDRKSLGSIPPNFLVHPYVPQLDVLQYTDIFITHGGMNSVMEALYYGVPLVVIPQMIEHTITAKRVEELGLGVVIEKNAVTVRTLQDAVAQVAGNPEFRTHAQSMRNAVLEAGGSRSAADAILQFSKANTSRRGPALT